MHCFRYLLPLDINIVARNSIHVRRWCPGVGIVETVWVKVQNLLVNFMFVLLIHNDSTMTDMSWYGIIWTTKNKQSPRSYFDFIYQHTFSILFTNILFRLYLPTYFFDFIYQHNFSSIQTPFCLFNLQRQRRWIWIGSCKEEKGRNTCKTFMFCCPLWNK